MAETAQNNENSKRITLTKGDRRRVWFHSWFILANFNYERMQNSGVCYTMIPAIRKLYKNKEDRAEALQRHLTFFNTHPYLASPIFGVTMALEEEKANGVDIDNSAIQGVKVGMMGPLAGVGDPLFWFTLRPIIFSLGASLAISGSFIGPILAFVLWNLIHLVFTYYTQEFGYNTGMKITEDLSGSLLHNVTHGASLMGMFVIGALIQRWVSIKFTWVYARPKVNGHVHPMTLQNSLDQLIPGLAGLLLTFLCMWLLKKKVSPIVIIIGIFVVGVAAHCAHII